MPWFKRYFELLLCALLCFTLLALEAGLLLQDSRDAARAQLRHQAELATERLSLRLYATLEHADLLSQQLTQSGADPARALSAFAHHALPDDSRFTGFGILRRIAPEQRAGFETRIANSIRMLKDRQLQTSPQQPLYYPVEAYLPDDGNALPQGLDLGSLDNARRKMDLARNSGHPVLMVNNLPGGNGLRLDIVARQGNPDTLLLLALQKDRLLQGAGSEPAGSNPLQHVRLIAWLQEQPDTPVLDSVPSQPLPSEPPLFTTRYQLGGSELLFSAYPLAAPSVALDGRAWSLLGLSALLLLGLGLLVQRQTGNQQELAEQLQHQQQLLEYNNRTLREQINDRVQSEQALMQSEARQRAILHASSDAIILIDNNGNILQVNPAAARLVGQEAETLPRLPAGALLPELYSNAPSAHLEQIALEHEGHPFESNLLKSDQLLLPVELSLSRVVQPEDWFYVVVCRDISVRKEQEAALIKLKNSLAEQVEVQSRQMAALLEASPMAMAYIVDRRLIRVNKAFLDLFERKEEDILGQTTLQFFESPEQFERTGKALYSLLNDGKVVQVELRLRTGEGRMIWCRLFGRAVNPSVPRLGTIWLYQDFSAQRAVEDALRHAKVMAEETSRAKTEFLANMSHELRTPLHAILGFTEIGQNRANALQEAKLAQYFARIHSSGARLLELLNDLLDLAKMEVGRMVYSLERHDLSHCLQEACDEMAPMASRHNLTLDLACTPTRLSADFDPMRIGQVMRNLLSNAIKFSPAGEAINISLRLLEQHGDEIVEVSVEDHGPGIPEAELEAIFDKFMQSSSTKTGAGGTGLGLAICREIIHAHGGQVRAANLPRGGAKLTLTFPRYHCAEEDAPHASQVIAR